MGNFSKKILFFNHKLISSNLIFPFFASFPLKSKLLLKFLLQKSSIKILPGPMSEAKNVFLPLRNVKFDIPPMLTTIIFFFFLKKLLYEKLEQEVLPHHLVKYHFYENRK